MQATRVAYRHFYRNAYATPTTVAATTARPNSLFLNKISKRTHVYDKRHYTVSEDILAIQTAKPWDHVTLRLTQRRMRRFSQYMVWFCTLYFGMVFCRLSVSISIVLLQFICLYFCVHIVSVYFLWCLLLNGVKLNVVELCFVFCFVLSVFDMFSVILAQNILHLRFCVFFLFCVFVVGILLFVYLLICLLTCA